MLCRAARKLFDSGKTYSDNLKSLSSDQQDAIRKELDGAYDDMIKRFETRIDTLRNNHGRTGE